MFKITRNTEEPSAPSKEAQETVLTELDAQVHAEEYDKAKTLAETYKILTEADKPAEKRANSDQVKVAWISGAASLLGILAVIRHEEVNVLASKALGLIVKPKI